MKNTFFLGIDTSTTSSKALVIDRAGEVVAVASSSHTLQTPRPLWSEQDLTAAREVLSKIKDTPKLTERERAYLAAVRLLYGDGDKRARDAAYSAAMEKIYRAYPNDLEAAAFYSLSLLGGTGHHDR